MTKLLLDASIVISWCEELSDLILFEGLLKCGYEIVLPKMVVNEVLYDKEKNQMNNITKKVLNKAKIRNCDRKRHEKLSNRYFRLGEGEIAVLTLGEYFERKNKSYCCILDDQRAREVCRELNLILKGTLGLCNILIEKGIIKKSKADKIIQKMKEKGARLPEDHQKYL